MKIAVFIKSTTLHNGFGGLETQNKVLCEGLAKRGHSVVVFSQKNNLEINSAEENGVKYIFVESSYRYLFSTLNKNSWYNKSVEAFKQVHDQNPFDLVISQSSAGYGVIEQKKSLKVKVIAIAHGTVVGEFKTLLNNIQIKNIKDLYWFGRNVQYVLRQFFGRQRQYLLHSNRVVAVSNAVKKQIIEETFILDDQVSVINNGIDEQKFFVDSKDNNGHHKEKLNLLYVGQVARDKGLDILPVLFADPKMKDVHVDVVGSGDYLQKLQEFVAKNGLQSSITLHGKVPYEKVKEFYFDKSVDVFIFPTKRVEGLPMVLVEAMFASLPVVAFDLGGVGDVVINNQNGYLLSAGDIIGFKNKLLSFIENKGVLDPLKQNALEHAKSNFTLDIMLTKYENVFKEVLK